MTKLVFLVIVLLGTYAAHGFAQSTTQIMSYRCTISKGTDTSGGGKTEIMAEPSEIHFTIDGAKKIFVVGYPEDGYTIKRLPLMSVEEFSDRFVAKAASNNSLELNRLTGFGTFKVKQFLFAVGNCRDDRAFYAKALESQENLDRLSKFADDVIKKKQDEEDNENSDAKRRQAELAEARKAQSERETTAALGQLAAAIAGRRQQPLQAQSRTPGSVSAQNGNDAGGRFHQPPTPSVSSRGQHDPAGEANHCIRANTSESYGGFTNICSFAISYLHCFSGVTKDIIDTSFYHCDRPGGLWAKSAPAGTLGPGKRNGTGIPQGGVIRTVVCREPFSIQDARFDGTKLVAMCVK